MKDYLRNALAGRVKLWKVFWLQFVLGWLVLSLVGLGLFVMIFAWGDPFVDPDAVLQSFLRNLPFFVLGFVYTGIGLWYSIVTIVSVWKCSWNSGRKIWGYLARGVVVLSFVYAVMEPWIE